MSQHHVCQPGFYILNRMLVLEVAELVPEPVAEGNIINNSFLLLLLQFALEAAHSSYSQPASQPTVACMLDQQLLLGLQL